MSIVSITEEIIRCQNKVRQYQQRISELTRKKSELENAQYISIIRKSNITPEILEKIIDNKNEVNANENS